MAAGGSGLCPAPPAARFRARASRASRARASRSAPPRFARGRAVRGRGAPPRRGRPPETTTTFASARANRRRERGGGGRGGVGARARVRVSPRAFSAPQTPRDVAADAVADPGSAREVSDDDRDRDRPDPRGRPRPPSPWRARRRGRGRGVGARAPRGTRASARAADLGRLARPPPPLRAPRRPRVRRRAPTTARARDARRQPRARRFRGRPRARGDLEACVARVAAALAADDDDADAGGLRVVVSRRVDGLESASASVRAAVGRRHRPAHKRFLGACASASRRGGRRLDLAMSPRCSPRTPGCTRPSSARAGGAGPRRRACSGWFALLARGAGLGPDAFAHERSLIAPPRAKARDSAVLARGALSDAVACGAADSGVFNAYVDAARVAATSSSARRVVASCPPRGSRAARPHVQLPHRRREQARTDLGAAKAALAALDAACARGLEATDRTFGAALFAAANGEPGDDGARAVGARRWRGRGARARAGTTTPASSLFTALARGVAAGAWPAKDALDTATRVLNEVATAGAPKKNAGGTGGSSPARASSGGGGAGPSPAVWSAYASLCARAGRAREALDAGSRRCAASGLRWSRTRSRRRSPRAAGTRARAAAGSEEAAGVGGGGAPLGGAWRLWTRSTRARRARGPSR